MGNKAFQNQRLDYLVEAFKADSVQYKDLQTPTDTEGRRRILRSLMNTMIIKYPFWAMTAENPNAVYACLNYNEAVCPEQIRDRAICVDGDSGEVLRTLKRGV